MKTDDLIAALARDARPALPPVPRLVLRGALIALPASILLFVLLLGPRADLGEAMADGWFALKLAVVAMAAYVGWRLASAAGSAAFILPVALLALPGAALLLAVSADLTLLDVAEWRERLVGDNAATCLVSIPLLAAAPLAGVILALRDAAPLRPALAGAAAGLMAGGLGTLLYGLHCTDDSPLFVGVWYVLAVGLVALAGAALGRAFLRW